MLAADKSMKTHSVDYIIEWQELSYYRNLNAIIIHFYHCIFSTEVNKYILKSHSRSLKRSPKLNLHSHIRKIKESSFFIVGNLLLGILLLRIFQPLF